MKRPPNRPPGRRSTPAGEHRPVLLDDVLAALDARPGQVVIDCTVGWAGHAVELLRRVGPAGRLVGKHRRQPRKIGVMQCEWAPHFREPFAGARQVLGVEIEARTWDAGRPRVRSMRMSRGPSRE